MWRRRRRRLQWCVWHRQNLHRHDLLLLLSSRASIETPSVMHQHTNTLITIMPYQNVLRSTHRSHKTHNFTSLFLEMRADFFGIGFCPNFFWICYFAYNRIRSSGRPFDLFIWLWSSRSVPLEKGEFHILDFYFDNCIVNFNACHA